MIHDGHSQLSYIHIYISQIVLILFRIQFLVLSSSFDYPRIDCCTTLLPIRQMNPYSKVVLYFLLDTTLSGHGLSR